MQFTLSQPHKLKREISFAQPQDDFHQKSKHSSPSIAKQQKSKYSETHLSSSPLHNLHYKYLPAYPSREQYRDHSREKDYKIVNMNDINKRIKGILDTMEHEEKRKEVYCQKYAINVPSNIIPRASRFSVDEVIENSRKMSQKRMAKNKQTYAKPPLAKSNLANSKHQLKENQQVRNSAVTTPNQNKYQSKKSQQKCKFNHSNMSSIKAENSGRSPLSETNQNIESKVYQPDAQYIKNQFTLHENKSSMKSSIYSNFSGSTIKKNKQNQDIYLKDKNINKEISKIQDKIWELQKIKKEMKLDFKQSSVLQRTSSLKHIQLSSFDSIVKAEQHIQTLTNSQTDQQLLKNVNNMTFNAEDIQLINSKVSSDMELIGQNITSCKFMNTINTVNQEDVYVPKILRNLPSKKKNGRNKNILSTEPSQFTTFGLNQMVHYNKIGQSSFMESKSIATEAQAKIAQNNNSMSLDKYIKTTDAFNVRNLLNNFQEQIKCDQVLRKSKKWFQKQRSDIKWKMLQNQLKDNNLWINEQCMKLMFSVASQEQNPFYTPRDEDYSIIELVQAFKIAEQHWTMHIEHMISESALVQGGFVLQNIDISKRGNVTIEDLVRYINYELDTFFRNRDVFLIFHRFKKGEMLYFSDIAECLIK